jgi:hypothetical protein
VDGRGSLSLALTRDLGSFPNRIGGLEGNLIFRIGRSMEKGARRRSVAAR